MNNIILADCLEEELTDLKEGLEDSTKQNWKIYSTISNWGRTSLWKKIKRYLVYFLAPIKVFLKRKEFSKIIGWQQFYALIFAFYCNIFKVKKNFNLYVVNFTYKEKNGFVGKIYYKFMKNTINSKYIDLLYVPSKDYIDMCSRILDVSKEKFVVLPFGIPDQYNKYKNDYIKGNYYLSIGRSNRDYDWLIKEWKNIKETLYIVSDNYKPNFSVPNNIKIIDNVFGNMQYPYIMGCKALIIPIDIENICSGDTVLLTAISFKKIVIVTEKSTLAEMYVNNGEDGFVVSKNKGELTKLINLINHDNLKVGNKAREKYLNNYSRKIMGINIGKSIMEE